MTDITVSVLSQWAASDREIFAEAFAISSGAGLNLYPAVELALEFAEKVAQERVATNLARMRRVAQEALAAVPAEAA